MEKLLKTLGFGNLTAEEMEVMLPTLIIGAVLLLIALVLIFERIENARFNSWVKRNSVYDTPLKPWRTLVPWHCVGSRWYEAHTEGSTIDGGKSFTKRADAADMDRLYNKINKTTKVRAHHYLFSRIISSRTGSKR